MLASDRVYDVLRREIVEGRLPERASLAEAEQAERLGVSRTPVREALARLITEGLAEAVGPRTTIVAPLPVERIREFFDVRAALECKAVALAAARRDPGVFRELRSAFAEAGDLARDGDRFHRRYYDLTSRLDDAIDDACGSAYLATLLSGVRTHIARVRRIAADDPERLRGAALEHVMIIDAIIDGAPAVASAAMELHIHRSLAHILDALQRGARAGTTDAA